MPARPSRSGAAALAILGAWALYSIVTRRTQGRQAAQGAFGLMPGLALRWLALQKDVPPPVSCGTSSPAPASPCSAASPAGHEDELPTPRRAEPLLLYACCGGATAAKPAVKAAGHRAAAESSGGDATPASATAAELKALRAYALLAFN